MDDTSGEGVRSGTRARRPVVVVTARRPLLNDDGGAFDFDIPMKPNRGRVVVWSSVAVTVTVTGCRVGSADAMVNEGRGFFATVNTLLLVSEVATLPARDLEPDVVGLRIVCLVERDARARLGIGLRGRSGEGVCASRLLSAEALPSEVETFSQSSSSRTMRFVDARGPVNGDLDDDAMGAFARAFGWGNAEPVGFNLVGTEIAVIVAVEEVEGDEACAALRPSVGDEDLGGEVMGRLLEPDDCVETLGAIVDIEVVEGDVR